MRKWLAAWTVLTSAPVLQCQIPPRSVASIEGSVLNDVTGEPLKNATVRLADLSQQTNEQGQFSFVNLNSGHWSLSADKGGFDTGYFGARKYIPLGSHVVIKENEHIKGVVLRLVPQGVITGRVLDSEGMPAEGAQVEVLKAGYSAGIRHWSKVAAATALDNGYYRVPKLRAGQYLIKCRIASIPQAPSARGVNTAYVSTYYPDVTDTASATPVDLKAGSETGGIDIRLTLSGVFRVSGRLQPPNGREADGYIALIDRADQTTTLRSAYVFPPDFHFDFPSMPPGSYTAYASWYAGGAAIDAQSLEVTDKDLDDLDLVLMPTGGEIRGSLELNPVGRQVDLHKVSVEIRPTQLDSSNIPYSETDLRLRIGEGLKFGFPITNQVRFAAFGVKVSNLPEGCYVASVEYGGRKVTEYPVRYSGGAVLEISIGTDGARIVGKTVDSDGKALGGAIVALVSTNPSVATASLVSDRDGGFQFNSVPPGSYKILAWDDISRDDIDDPSILKQFEDFTTDVKVVASDATTVSLRVISQ